MAEKQKKVTGTHLTCPYCDAEIAAAAFPYCEACKVTVLRCPVCHMTVDRDGLQCPHCGADLKEGA
jgi:predicted amidophosphoribosyltransferase